MVKVLFVCMNNICRSPTAEGVFTRKVEEAGLLEKIGIDSAGTHAYHIGEPPDPRAQQSASARGVAIGHLKARKVTAKDFDAFDYVLAMDMSNHQNLVQICPPGSEHKLKLFMEFAPHLNIKEVPDPYYGDLQGFERVLDMIEATSDGLLTTLRQLHLHS